MLGFFYTCCLAPCSVEFGVPLSEMAQALAQGYLWREAIVALKGCGIGIGGGHIAWSFDKLRMYCMCIMSLREGVLSKRKPTNDLISLQE